MRARQRAHANARTSYYWAEVTGQHTNIYHITDCWSQQFNSLFVTFFRAIHGSRSSSLGATHEHQRLTRERKIFIQFFITNIWLAIFDIPFILIGYLEEPSHWLGYFVTLMYVINCSINGWVYLILNKTIQREVKEWIRDLPTWIAFNSFQTQQGSANHICTDSNMSLSQIRVRTPSPLTINKEVNV